MARACLQHFASLCLLPTWLTVLYFALGNGGRLRNMTALNARDNERRRSNIYFPFYLADILHRHFQLSPQWSEIARANDETKYN